MFVVVSVVVAVVVIVVAVVAVDFHYQLPIAFAGWVADAPAGIRRCVAIFCVSV